MPCARPVRWHLTRELACPGGCSQLAAKKSGYSWPALGSRPRWKLPAGSLALAASRSACYWSVRPARQPGCLIQCTLRLRLLGRALVSRVNAVRGAGCLLFMPAAVPSLRRASRLRRLPGHFLRQQPAHHPANRWAPRALWAAGGIGSWEGLGQASLASLPCWQCRFVQQVCDAARLIAAGGSGWKQPGKSNSKSN